MNILYCITPLAWVEIQSFALTAYMLICLHVLLRASLHAYMLTRLQAYTLTCVQAYIRTRYLAFPGVPQRSQALLGASWRSPGFPTNGVPDNLPIE